MAYEINKGVGKPVEFYGLQAQYIGYLFGGAIGNFIVFAIVYVCTSPFISITYLIFSTVGLGFYIFSSGKKYGEHGLGMRQAKQAQPKYLVIRDPRFFRNLKGKK